MKRADREALAKRLSKQGVGWKVLALYRGEEMLTIKELEELKDTWNRGEPNAPMRVSPKMPEILDMALSFRKILEAYNTLVDWVDVADIQLDRANTRFILSKPAKKIINSARRLCSKCGLTWYSKVPGCPECKRKKKGRIRS